MINERKIAFIHTIGLLFHSCSTVEPHRKHTHSQTNRHCYDDGASGLISFNATAAVSDTMICQSDLVCD